MLASRGPASRPALRSSRWARPSAPAVSSCGRGRKRFEVLHRHGHRRAWPVGNDDRDRAWPELLGHKVTSAAGPAAVGEVLSHRCWCRGSGHRRRGAQPRRWRLARSDLRAGAGGLSGARALRSRHRCGRWRR